MGPATLSPNCIFSGASPQSLATDLPPTQKLQPQVSLYFLNDRRADEDFVGVKLILNYPVIVQLIGHTLKPCRWARTSTKST